MAQDVALMLGADKRSLFAEAVLLNAVVEKAPGQISKPVAVLARPGMVEFAADVSAGRVRGVAYRDGCFNGDTLVVIATELWRVTPAGIATQISGTVLGDLDCRLAIGQDADLVSVVYIAAGDGFFVYTDGGDPVAQDATWTSATGVAGATDVVYHKNDFLAIEAGTDKVYFQLPADPWTALQFASAERSTDSLLALVSIGDQVLLLGSDTNEAWVKTGEASPPYAPYGGLAFDYGCLTRGAAIGFMGAAIWIDKAYAVRMSQGGDAEIISTNGIAEQIRKVGGGIDISAWWFSLDQHLYYVLNLAGISTWVFDLSLRTWMQWRTAGRDYWKPFLGVTVGAKVLAFDHESTTIWRLDPEADDDAGDPFSWEFMGKTELKSGVADCSNLQLTLRTGRGPREGYGSDPVMQMRMSDDEGEKWSRWRDRPMGATGKTRQLVRWNALGQIEAPWGRIFHFRCNASVGRRVSDISMNCD